MIGIDWFLLSHKPSYHGLKGLRTDHLDITSLIKHIDFKVFLGDQQLEVLTIKETRLHNKIEDREVEIPSYDIVRYYRNRNGRGVAIYVRENLPFTMRDDLLVQGIEAICVEIKKAKSKLLLMAT